MLKTTIEQISNFIELKIAVRFLLMILKNNTKHNIETEVRAVIEKTDFAVNHMKTKNKMSLNFIQSYVTLINIAIENYPGIFQEDDNTKISNNLDFCIKTIVENKNTDLTNKIEIFNNTYNLYTNALNKESYKYLFETLVLQPVIRMMDSTITDNKLDNISQHHFHLGKHPVYSVCTRLIKLIDVLGVHLSDAQLVSVFKVYERAVPYISSSEILETLEIVSKYDQAKNCVPMLLENLFSRYEISTYFEYNKYLIFNVFYNTDKKKINIEKLLDFMIIHDIKMKNMKQALGLAIYIYEELSDKSISLAVLSKFYRQLEKVNDVNLSFLNKAVQNYLSTVSLNNLSFFDIAYLPFDFLPDNYRQLITSGENFDISHWSPHSLNLLIEYMSKNNVYIHSFMTILQANVESLLNSDFNTESLSQLNVPYKYLEIYLDLMRTFISAKKLTKSEITDVLFTYFINKDYYSNITSDDNIKQFDEFYTSLVHDIIVKEDIFGLILYNSDLQAFSYPSFDKVMGLTVTNPDILDTIKGNYDTPSQYNIKMDESIEFKADLMLYDDVKLNLELYKRFYFWSRFNEKFMEVHKFPLEYNNLHYKKFERYNILATKNFYKIMKDLGKYKNINKEKIILKTYFSDQKVYSFVPVEFKYSIASGGSLSRDTTNVCKLLAMRTSQENGENALNLNIVSLDELEKDAGLLESLNLDTFEDRDSKIEDEEDEDEADKEIDVVGSAIDREKDGAIEM